MKSSKFWIAVVVGGIVMNIFDYILHGVVLNNMYYAKMTDVFNQMTNPVWYVVGDFISVLVFAWVYDRVYSSFAGGPKGGMTFGFYAGVFMTFPSQIFLHLMVKGFPYGLSWIWIAAGIVWYVVAGTVVGALYKKAATASAS